MHGLSPEPDEAEKFIDSLHASVKKPVAKRLCSPLMSLKSYVLVLSCACALAQVPARAQESTVAVSPTAAMSTRKDLLDQWGQHISQAKDTVGQGAQDLVTHAMGLLGVPYKWGGNSETRGLDCSGLVRNVYEKTFGMVLPRRAEEQAAATETIERAELQPGDLVFFNTMKRAFSHVGIYVGDGKFIHAPRKGKRVKIDDMRSAYWQKRFNGARRVQAETQAPATLQAE
jgi:cell wall-associated NlpC family hydrolase